MVARRCISCGISRAKGGEAEDAPLNGLGEIQYVRILENAYRPFRRAGQVGPCKNSAHQNKEPNTYYDGARAALLNSRLNQNVALFGAIL